MTQLRAILFLAGCCWGFASSCWADSPGEQSKQLELEEIDDVQIGRLVEQLGAQEFRVRRQAFLQIWQMGEQATELIEAAKSSSNVQVAQAAHALEPLLKLELAQQSSEIAELVLSPSPVSITTLCERGYWELAAKVLRSNAQLRETGFAGAAGTYFLNEIAKSALAQGDAALAWPVVQAVRSAEGSEFDGTDLSVWIAVRTGLALDDPQIGPADLAALQDFYRGHDHEETGAQLSPGLSRKLLTRGFQWSQFANRDVQNLILGDQSGAATNVARAVLFEIAGDFVAAEAIWEEELRSAEESWQRPQGALGELGELEGDDLAAYQLILSVPAAQRNQVLVAVLMSGRTRPVAQYVQNTNPQAAFEFYYALGDYKSVFESVGLQPDLSNFSNWIVVQENILRNEARRRGGTDEFDKAAHMCSLLVGLGFREQADAYVDTILSAADTRKDLWEYSIGRYLNRGESRDLTLRAIQRVFDQMPTDTQQTILQSFFPDFENCALELSRTMPPLTAVDRVAPDLMQAMEHLHIWDNQFFADHGTSIATWINNAVAKVTRARNVGNQRDNILLFKEFAAIALGSGDEELALELAMQDLALTPAEAQVQRLVGAEVLLQQGDAESAADLFASVRSAENATVDHAAMVREIRALLLSGQHDRAFELEISRWLRPLAMTRFYQGTHYATVAGEFEERADFDVADEYATLAFQLSGFSSMDVYWAAWDISSIADERDEFETSANALRAAMVEALMPDSAIVDFQIKNANLHFLMSTAKRERIHRAAACIADGQIEVAKRQMKIGQKLQPQDIEMVVACYSRLLSVDQADLANDIFDQYEATMLAHLSEWENDAMALNNLAWMYARCDRKLVEAKSLSQHAIELAPHSATYLDTLAEIQFRLGEVDAALASMRECVRMDPRSNHYRENMRRFTRGQDGRQ